MASSFQDVEFALDALFFPSSALFLATLCIFFFFLVFVEAPHLFKMLNLHFIIAQNQHRAKAHLIRKICVYRAFNKKKISNNFSQEISSISNMIHT